ncbi:MAG: hypothetical protein RMJ67_05720 [Elusimicrobiota bacterium]|nr:hypothetical protein [Endomicrobiia bacterium]MDW8165989.1 hypothetical protein [Elusimicrobiota bacterium]
MKEKLKKIFEEILNSEIIYFSYSEESLFPEISKEEKKVLKIEYREVKEEKKITEKQLNFLRRVLERGRNKEILKEKFNLNPEDIQNISSQKAKEILDFLLEVKNA